jgi:hypothetical protein
MIAKELLMDTEIKSRHTKTTDISRADSIPDFL